MTDLLFCFIILFCLTLFILILYIIMISKICNSKSSLEYYTYNNEDYDISQPVIIMLGSTHGNEPAGYYSIKNLMEKLNTGKIKINNGKLILIPAVNYCAFQLGLRFIPFIGDMNRKYPYNLNTNPSNKIISQITDLVQKADFILDFHEGWGFNRQNKNSMGSTLTPTNNEICNKLAIQITDSLDKTVDKDYMKFRIYTEDENLIKNSDLYQKQNKIEGTLSYYCQMLGKNYILVETSGQNNISPLELRIKQNEIIINDILKYYKLI
jgi:hypothetical protein